MLEAFNRKLTLSNSCSSALSQSPSNKHVKRIVPAAFKQAKENINTLVVGDFGKASPRNAYCSV